MGINLEYVTLLSILREQGHLSANGSVLELGAQDISAGTDQLMAHLARLIDLLSCSRIKSAQDLYTCFGLKEYACIDANGKHGSMVYDLNQNLVEKYDFLETYDIVTNLGTLEHCFNISNGFMNIHNVCRKGGLMIHAMPTQSNVNHGFYNIQPRLLANIAAVNRYETLHLYFTVDCHPELFQYNLDNYKLFDDRDLMVYCVFRKTTEDEFKMPFDDIFSGENNLFEYPNEIIPEDFAAYIKDKWENIIPDSIEKVNCTPTWHISNLRKLKKSMINLLGKNRLKRH